MTVLRHLGDVVLDRVVPADAEIVALDLPDEAGVHGVVAHRPADMDDDTWAAWTERLHTDLRMLRAIPEAGPLLTELAPGVARVQRGPVAIAPYELVDARSPALRDRPGDPQVVGTTENASSSTQNPLGLVAVRYDAASTQVNARTRPPRLGLVHELVHAGDWLHGGVPGIAVEASPELLRRARSAAHRDQGVEVSAAGIVSAAGVTATWGASMLTVTATTTCCCGPTARRTDAPEPRRRGGPAARLAGRRAAVARAGHRPRGGRRHRRAAAARAATGVARAAGP